MGEIMTIVIKVPDKYEGDLESIFAQMDAEGIFYEAQYGVEE